VAGGLTLAFTVGAVSTGVIYLSRRSKYGTSQSEADYEATRRWHIINLPLTGAAIVGGIATTYLYLSRPAVPASQRSSTSATISPWFGPSSGGLLVEGSL
jgi:hypothetical protein